MAKENKTDFLRWVHIGPSDLGWKGLWAGAWKGLGKNSMASGLGSFFSVFRANRMSRDMCYSSATDFRINWHTTLSPDTL